MGDAISILGITARFNEAIENISDLNANLRDMEACIKMVMEERKFVFCVNCYPKNLFPFYHEKIDLQTPFVLRTLNWDAKTPETAEWFIHGATNDPNLRTNFYDLFDEIYQDVLICKDKMTVSDLRVTKTGPNGELLEAEGFVKVTLVYDGRWKMPANGKYILVDNRGRAERVDAVDGEIHPKIVSIPCVILPDPAYRTPEERELRRLMRQNQSETTNLAPT